MFCLKIRVRLPVSETVSYRHVKGIKIAIADVDSLRIKFFLHIFVVAGECGAVRIIFILVCPTVCQLPRGCHRTAYHICEGISAFHPGLHDIEQGFNIGVLLHKRKIHKAAGIDRHHHMGIKRADIRQLLFLFFRQLIVSRAAVPVFSLSCHAAQNKDSDVCLRFCDRAACRHHKRCPAVYPKKFQGTFRFFRSP